MTVSKIPFAQLRLDDRDVPRSLATAVDEHNVLVDTTASRWEGTDDPVHDPRTDTWSSVISSRDKRRDTACRCLQGAMTLGDDAKGLIGKIDDEWKRQVSLFDSERVGIESAAREQLLTIGYEDSSDAGSMRLDAATSQHPLVGEHDAKTSTARKQIGSRLEAIKRIRAAVQVIEKELNRLFETWTRGH